MEALKMEKPMDNWNDDRLDELSRRVDGGFAKVDERFKQVDEHFVRVEGEMKAGFAKVDKRFEKVDERFEKVEGEMKAGFANVEAGRKADFEKLNGRFDRLLHALAFAGIGFGITMVVSVVGFIVTQA
jgi:tetrahydromethanopterin S-methyltransferase subunit G